MSVTVRVVPRERLGLVWGVLAPGFEVYAKKSPHETGTLQEIWEELTAPDGDELVCLGLDGRYAGFISFRIQHLEGEVWGTLGMIYLTPEAQKAGILPEVGEKLAVLLRARGCEVMNYMTARKGFARLAPKLGFRSRIVEWMKEL